MEYKAAGNTDTPSYKGNEAVISKKIIEITCLMELLDLDLKNHLELLYNMYNDQNLCGNYFTAFFLANL